MRQPPKVPEAAIIKLLEANYALQSAHLIFLPLGADSSSFGYRVQTSREVQFFLKARKPEWFNPASLVVPRQLALAGVSGVVAPLPTISQDLWVTANGFDLDSVSFFAV